MIVNFKPCNLKGNIDAPSSKSMAHRYLIGAALSKEICLISGVDYSEDILASIDCLKSLGAEISIDKDTVCINSKKFMENVDNLVLECRESGSTLRFLIPLALCLGKEVVLKGSTRLLERPLDVYEELCNKYHFILKKDTNSITLCGKLESGDYKVRGNVSSQFITGLIFALVYLGEDSSIEIIPPFESRPYVDLTISVLKSFGATIEFVDEYHIAIKKSFMNAFSGRIEGDYSNAAFLDAFNCIGSDITIHNLNSASVQGDKVYEDYFKKVVDGEPILDISDYPDLGPVLIALAALKNGATLTGTDRLQEKESNRGKAMHEELQKIGGRLIFGENSITIPKQELSDKGMILSGHNDHRIVMAMSVILSKIGGKIDGAEAVKKSYPNFFEDIKKLGAEVEILV